MLQSSKIRSLSLCACVGFLVSCVTTPPPSHHASALLSHRKPVHPSARQLPFTSMLARLRSGHSTYNWPTTFYCTPCYKQRGPLNPQPPNNTLSRSKLTATTKVSKKEKQLVNRCLNRLTNHKIDSPISS